MGLAYLSLGSNVGDRAMQLRRALAELEKISRLSAVSSFYETEPVEFTAQAWFINCAAAVETSKTPRQLMAALLQIERQLGRERTLEKGPRSIDIDMLLFDDVTLDSKQLILPHPAMQQRRFVLEPLAEIASGAVHPVLGKTIQELLTALPRGQKVIRLPPECALP